MCIFCFSLLITSLGHVKLTDFGLSKMGLMNCEFISAHIVSYSIDSIAM